jgi:hypothetical protein
MRAIVEEQGISAELTVEWRVMSTGRTKKPTFEILAYGPHDRGDVKALVTIAEQHFLELTPDGSHLRLTFPPD